MKKLFSETSGQGPDLVLLHGWGIHSSVWQSVVSKLNQEFKVTIIDLPGFGRSESLCDYSVENIIKHLLEVAPAKAIWLGWSLGGLLATKIAAEYPDRVEKLICVASSPKFLKTADWPGINIEILLKFAEQLHSDYKATLNRFLLLQFYGLPLNKEMLRWLQSSLFLYGSPSMQTLQEGLNLLQNLDYRVEVEKINCPILYILGRLDTLVPAILAEKLQQFSRRIETVILPKASHALFLTHENDFLKHLRRFAYE